MSTALMAVSIGSLPVGTDQVLVCQAKRFSAVILLCGSAVNKVAVWIALAMNV